MNYDQLVQIANARFESFARQTQNASKQKFNAFPLELRIEMTFDFFISHCI